MKYKKFKIMSIMLLSLFAVSITIPSALSVKVLADDIALSAYYDVLEDNSEVRKVREFSKDSHDYIIYTYHKNTGFLDIEKNGITKSYDVVSIGNGQLAGIIDVRAANSSMFSPWSYSSSGNRYTLRIAHASYGGRVVSKTANRSGRNSGYIDGFVSSINDLRNAEWGIIQAAGWELAGAVIGAIITGGLGAVTAITGVTAIYQAASALPPIYDRALYNYNNVR